jgi:uncharacterized damage-inducible protein DinB
VSFEAQQLAELSTAVRESSLTRLERVPPGRENWRPTPDSLSCAEIAQHLVDADEWLFAKLENPDLRGMKAVVGMAPPLDRAGYAAVRDRLGLLGEKRAQTIAALSAPQLAAQVFDDRFGRPVSLWWVILRGNLDHEAHHRGQLASYIRILAHRPAV